MSTIYKVKAGESLPDVALNATGGASVDTILAIVEANGYQTYTPILIADDSVIIPDNIERQTNNLPGLISRPSSNKPDGGYQNIYNEIIELYSLMATTVKRGTYTNSDLNVDYVYTIVHELNTDTPNVNIYDGAGMRQVEMNITVTRIDSNTVSITHAGAITGTWSWEVFDV